MHEPAEQRSAERSERREAAELSVAQKEARRRKLETALQGAQGAKRSGALCKKRCNAYAGVSVRGFFSSHDFWIDLRSRVHRQKPAEEQAEVDRARAQIRDVMQAVKRFRFEGQTSAAGVGSPAAVGTQLENQSFKSCGTTTPTEMEESEERVSSLVVRARERFGKEGSMDATLRAMLAVSSLLGRVRRVEEAYPCVYTCGHEHKAPNGAPLEPKSLSLEHPEFACGSIADGSTFVTNLETLERWLSIAVALLLALEREQALAEGTDWSSPDLGGILHKAQLRDFGRRMLARVRPVLAQVSTRRGRQ